MCGHVLKSLYQLQAGLAAGNNLTNITACQKFVDFREKGGPFIREIADDDILKSCGELDGDESRRSGSEEREERRLECFTVRQRNGGTIRPNFRGIDVIAGVYAIFEPNGTRLTSSTVMILLMSVRGMIRDASNTNVSTLSVDIICRRAVTTPSWPAI